MSMFKLLLLKAKSVFNSLIEENDCHYINSYDSLPSPLSSEEEREAIMLLDANDVLARNMLIEHNLRLVVYISRKFDSSNVLLEDLISIGTIGLIKAVNTYKSDKKIKLATYASKCIENEILMYLRKTNKQKNEISLDEPLNMDIDGNELLLCDIISSNDMPVEYQIEKESEMNMLQKAIDSLSPKEKEIITLRYGFYGMDKLTQKEIAEMMKISQSYISRLEKKIILRLKKEINRMS